MDITCDEEKGDGGGLPGASIATEILQEFCGTVGIKKQDDYRGTINVTMSGLPCQKWTEQTPHQHSRVPENYPNSGVGDHNYCRYVLQKYLHVNDGRA